MEKINVIVEEFESPKNKFDLVALIFKSNSDSNIFVGKVLKTQIEMFNFESTNYDLLIYSVFEFISTQGNIINVSSID